MLRFKCTSCGYERDVGDKYLHKDVRCPACKIANHVTGEVLKTAGQENSIIKFRCPSCNQKIGLTQDYAGKRVKCAKCSNPLVVPGTGGAAGEERQVSQQDHGEERSEFYNLLEPAAEVEKGPAWQGAGGTAERAAPGFRRESPAKAGGGNKTLFVIVGAACVVLVVAVVIILCVWGKGDAIEKQGKFDLYEAQEFAEEFISLLEEGRTYEATQSFVPEVQDSVSQDKLSEMTKLLGAGGRLTSASKHEYFDETSREKFFLFYYNLGDEEHVEQFVCVCILESGDNLLIEGVSINDIFGEGVSVASMRFDEIAARAMLSPLFALAKAAVGILVVAAVVIIFMMICMCIVYSKAGQPAWAALVPVYNLWVLAEIADKPGWYGLGIALAGFIPIVGPVVQIILHISISIGVASAFDRGVIFGIGLFFLPFVFYPVLAFSRN